MLLPVPVLLVCTHRLGGSDSVEGHAQRQAISLQWCGSLEVGAEKQGFECKYVGHARWYFSFAGKGQLIQRMPNRSITWGKHIAKMS